MAQIGAMDQKRITRLRKRLGLSQAELAARLGVDRTAVFRWESAKLKTHRTPTGSAVTLLKQLETESKERV